MGEARQCLAIFRKKGGKLKEGVGSFIAKEKEWERRRCRVSIIRTTPACSCFKEWRNVGLKQKSKRGLHSSEDFFCHCTQIRIRVDFVSFVLRGNLRRTSARSLTKSRSRPSPPSSSRLGERRGDGTDRFFSNSSVPVFVCPNRPNLCVVCLEKNLLTHQLASKTLLIPVFFVH